MEEHAKSPQVKPRCHRTMETIVFRVLASSTALDNGEGTALVASPSLVVMKVATSLEMQFQRQSGCG